MLGTGEPPLHNTESQALTETKRAGWGLNVEICSGGCGGNPWGAVGVCDVWSEPKMPKLSLNNTKHPKHEYKRPTKTVILRKVQPQSCFVLSHLPQQTPTWWECWVCPLLLTIFCIYHDALVNDTALWRWHSSTLWITALPELRCSSSKMLPNMSSAGPGHGSAKPGFKVWRLKATIFLTENLPITCTSCCNFLHLQWPSRSRGLGPNLAYFILRFGEGAILEPDAPVVFVNGVPASLHDQCKTHIDEEALRSASLVLEEELHFKRRERSGDQEPSLFLQNALFCVCKFFKCKQFNSGSDRVQRCCTRTC